MFRVALLFVFLSAPAAAQQRTRVHFGLYPVRVGALDMQAGSAEVTYYVWTRWRGELDATRYELVNGTIEGCDQEFREDANGWHYAYERCRATIDVDADYHSFPLDEHALVLQFEPQEDDDVFTFVVDRASIAHVESPTLSGWIVDRPRYEIGSHTYRTNWGYPGSAGSERTTFSSLRVTMRMRHDMMATFTKTFLTLFISVLITFLAFLMHPEELEARVGVGVAGIFGAVTSHAVAAANVPDISYLTLSDQIHIAGLAFILIALLQTCAAGWLFRRDRADVAKRIDKIARVVMLPSYAAIVVILVAAC